MYSGIVAMLSARNLQLANIQMTSSYSVHVLVHEDCANIFVLDSGIAVISQIVNEFVNGIRKILK